MATEALLDKDAALRPEVASGRRHMPARSAKPPSLAPPTDKQNVEAILTTMGDMSQANGDRPSVVLARMRDQILTAAQRHNATNVRVFGSIATGADTASSDVDLIVHFTADASLYDQINLIEELEDLLGFHVDVISDGAAGVEQIAPVIAV